MRLACVLLLLLLLPVALAEPPTPPELPDTSGLPTDVPLLVLVSVRGEVNPVRITYEHTAVSPMSCALYVDNSRAASDTFVGKQRESMTLSVGTHQAYATCDDLRSETIRFEIHETTSAASSGGAGSTGGVSAVGAGQGIPAVVLDAEPTFGQPFTVYGSGFPPSDDISLLLIGGGSTSSYMVNSDATGRFSYPFPADIPQQNYQLIARSTTQADQTASLSFQVLPAQSQTAGGLSGPEEWVAQEPLPVEPSQQKYPEPELTAPIPESPALIAESTQVEGSSWLLWLIPLLLIVVFGGVLGYLISQGTIDVSSIDAFKRSAASLFGGKQSTVSQGQRNTIRNFIVGERGKGFDDLTIRNALIEKGWEGHDIDAVFDQIYKQK